MCFCGSRDPHKTHGGGKRGLCEPQKTHKPQKGPPCVSCGSHEPQKTHGGGKRGLCEPQ